ncbi:MAG: nitrogen regulation protein NR(II) [Nevskiales bacterium]
MPNRPHSPEISPNQLLDNLATAVLFVDTELRVQYLNPACEMLLGVSHRHVQGQPLEQALPQLAEQAARVGEALADGSAYTERELTLQHFGEDPTTVDCSVTPATLGSARGALLEFSALDRHLRTSRDDQLQAQHEASRLVVRGLAHEIKNPLGGLRGAAQLLERELGEPALKDYTRIIIHEADRLQNLVNRLLGPNKPPQKAPLNIHQPLEHVRQLIEVDLSDEISLVRDYDPSIPDLTADSEQLIQVFLNVLRNAVHAVGDCGRIVLRTRTRRRFPLAGQSHRLVIQVDVEDNGPGVPPELAEKIFYPMITTRPQGTGLGLSIAQSLVHAHGGLIECSSQPGETIFSIYLPLGADV